MPREQELNFVETLREFEKLGVRKSKIAECAEVEPSTVSRWFKHESVPTDPESVLKKIVPLLQEELEKLPQQARSEVSSWRAVTGEMDESLRAHVQATGLMASTYFVVVSWIPTSKSKIHYDVVIHRFFAGVWADMARSRRLCNIGDLTQTVTPLLGDAPAFDQSQPIGKNVTLVIRQELEEFGNPLARLHVQLDVDNPSLGKKVIAYLGDSGFGYRYRATSAILRSKMEGRQETNDFLGAPIVLPCKRFKLLVCIPRTCFVGSPEALSYSNRSMLSILMRLDISDPQDVESLLWPLGQRYEVSSGPESPLHHLVHVDSFLDNLPDLFRSALDRPADLDGSTTSLREVLQDHRSECFLLDLHYPQPSQTHTIVWRLRPGESGFDERQP